MPLNLGDKGRILQTVCWCPRVMGFNGAFRRNKLWYAGLSEATVYRYAEEFVDVVLVDFLAEPVLELIEGLRREGHAPILLTGAPSFLARAMARRLAFDDVVSTELEVRDGRFTGRLAGPHYFGDAKVEGVHDLVRRHALDLAECVGLADHPADIPFLSCFGRPIAAHPRPALREHAHRQGWEVLDRVSEPPGGSATLRSEPTSPVRR